MQKICVQISDSSSVAALIEELDKQIPESKKNHPEFGLLYDQVVACMEDFKSKVIKLVKTGTTIHLEKEIVFPDFSVLITLDYPKKQKFFDRVKMIFGG